MNDFVKSQSDVISVCRDLMPAAPILGGDVGFLLAGVPVEMQGIVVRMEAQRRGDFMSQSLPPEVLGSFGVPRYIQSTKGRIKGFGLNGVSYGIAAVGEEVCSQSEIRSMPMCARAAGSEGYPVAHLGNVLSEISSEIHEARMAGEPDQLMRLLASWMCVYVIAAIENPKATFFALSTELLESMNLADMQTAVITGFVRFFEKRCSKTFATRMGRTLVDAFKYPAGRMRGPELPWESVAEFQEDAAQS